MGARSRAGARTWWGTVSAGLSRFKPSIHSTGSGGLVHSGQERYNRWPTEKAPASRDVGCFVPISFPPGMPRFSIVLPTRNRPSLLKVAVQTILRQTFQDWELVLSDNSTN